MHCEAAAHVAMPGRPLQADLGLTASGSHEAVQYQREREDRRDFPSDDGRLIEPAGAKSSDVQWHGDDEIIRPLQRCETGTAPLEERASQLVVALVLETMNGLPGGALEVEESERVIQIVRRDPTWAAAESGLHVGKVRQGQGSSAGRTAGRFNGVKVPPADRAERKRAVRLQWFCTECTPLGEQDVEEQPKG